MHVLSIARDPAVFNSSSIPFWKTILYASILGKYSVISTSKNPTIPGWQDKIKAFDCFACGSSSIYYWTKGFNAAIELHKRYPISFVLSHEPFFCGLFSLRLRNKLKIPMLQQVHGDYLDNPNWTKLSIINIVKNPIQKKVVKQADFVQAVSSRVTKKLLELGINQEKIIQIPVYTPIETFTSYTPNSQKDFTEPTFLWVGRLEKEKDPFLFVKIASKFLKLKKAKFIMVGHGSLQSQVENLTKTLGMTKESFEMKGALAQKDLASLYWSSTATLNTSPAEGFGLTMVESMACKTPCVMYDTGLAGELLLHDKNGFVIKDRTDLQEWISALTLLCDESRNKKFGKIAQDSVQKVFEKTAYFTKFKRAYEKISNSKK